MQGTSNPVDPPAPAQKMPGSSKHPKSDVSASSSLGSPKSASSSEPPDAPPPMASTTSGELQAGDQERSANAADDSLAPPSQSATSRSVRPAVAGEVTFGSVPPGLRTQVASKLRSSIAVQDDERAKAAKLKKKDGD